MKEGVQLKNQVKNTKLGDEDIVRFIKEQRIRCFGHLDKIRNLIKK